MREMIELIRLYWVQLIFLISIFSSIYVFSKTMIEATKCTLRNDILDIYDRCKIDKKITHYELEAIQHSAEVYFKLKGNSFVKDVVKRVEQFELID